jgi:hypothetical protein
MSAELDPSHQSGSTFLPFVRPPLRRFVKNNWKVVLYVILIVLCVLFTPEQPMKFIYTEF